MSVHRIMGLETEFGLIEGNPDPHRTTPLNPMLMSGLLVRAYSQPDELSENPLHDGGKLSSRCWDYADETPLIDARGWQLSRGEADPMQLTDSPVVFDDSSEDLTLANLVLTNGARLYVDHAHPEYSTPEVTNPWDALIYDKAGDQIAVEAARRLALTDGVDIWLYKNNTDNKGASYGTHENYLMRREVPFDNIVAGLLPFFVTRQIYAGSGKVGIGRNGEEAGFQLSQRADFFEAEVGLETTARRPIVNSRDEPHARADRYRRLHVIIGDANLSETSTILKMGTTALVLALIEDGSAPDLELATSVTDLIAISHDTSLSHQVALADGRTMTALDIQWHYFEAAHKLVERQQADDPQNYTAQTLSLWHDTLTALGSDPMSLHRTLDWVAKYRLLNAMRERDNLGWDSAKIALADLQYSDLRPGKGLYNRLASRAAITTIIDPSAVMSAAVHPPSDTRAYFRGRCLSQYATDVVAASWDSVVFDVGAGNHARVPMNDPHRGTRRHVGELFDRRLPAAELVTTLLTP